MMHGIYVVWGYRNDSMKNVGECSAMAYNGPETSSHMAALLLRFRGLFGANHAALRECRRAIAWHW